MSGAFIYLGYLTEFIRLRAASHLFLVVEIPFSSRALIQLFDHSTIQMFSLPAHFRCDQPSGGRCCAGPRVTFPPFRSVKTPPQGLRKEKCSFAFLFKRSLSLSLPSLLAPPHAPIPQPPTLYKTFSFFALSVAFKKNSSPSFNPYSTPSILHLNSIPTTTSSTSTLSKNI